MKNKGNNKKNILVVYDDIPGGGSLSLVLCLIRQLRSSYDFYLLCGLYPNQKINKEDLALFKEVFHYEMKSSRNEVEKFLFVSSQTKKLIKRVSGHHEFDFVILNFLYSSVGIIFSKVFRSDQIVHFAHTIFYLYKKSIIWGANRSFTQTLQMSLALLFYRILQVFILRYGTVICFSNYQKGLLRSKLGCRKDIHILTVPFKAKKNRFNKGEYKEKLGFSKNTKLLLFTSRIEPHKGLHTLLKAMDLLKTSDSLTLVIKGPFYDKAMWYFLEMITNIKQKEKVHIYHLSKTTPEMLNDYYCAADATIMPSTELECFGMVTLESLSVGTPVICLPSGASKHIVSLVDTSLVSGSMTSRSLAKTISWFLSLEKSEVKKIVSKIPSVLSQHFSLKALLSQFDQILSNAQVNC